MWIVRYAAEVGYMNKLHEIPVVFRSQHYYLALAKYMILSFRSKAHIALIENTPSIYAFDSATRGVLCRVCSAKLLFANDGELITNIEDKTDLSGVDIHGDNYTPVTDYSYDHWCHQHHCDTIICSQCGTRVD